MNKLRVLMFSPDFPPEIHGGIGIHVNRLVNHLCLDRVSVTLMVAKIKRKRTDEYSISNINGVRVVSFPTLDVEPNEGNHSYWPFIWNDLNRDLFEKVMTLLENDQQQYDVIHAHDFYHSLVVVALKEKLQVPVVTTIHSLSLPDWHFDDSHRRFIINNSEKVISVSSDLSEKIIDRFGLKVKDKVKVIYNGVDPSSQESQTFEHDDNLITFCGRLFPTKGCAILLQAFKLLLERESTEGLRMVFIGDGPLKRELHDLRDKLGLTSRVEFLGFLEPSVTRSWMRRALFNVVPSIEEPFGLVALEAMAEGTPVITTTAGGLKEFVVNRENGLTVPPGTIPELTDAMHEMVLQKSLREKCIKNGIVTVNKHRWSNVALETEKIYNFAKSSFKESERRDLHISWV